MRALSFSVQCRLWSCVCSASLCAAAVAASPKYSTEIATRAQIAASNLADALVVDCQLPGRLQQLGGMRTYLTPGALMRLPAIDCRTRGGEYTVGDLASGTLSLSRWLPLAQKDNVEAQYYVARIYANGMDGVPVDYAKAAQWYQRAAQKQYAPAMQELGYLYEQGLGVQQDALAGLNLQREASGLGSDLDYASKLTASREEAARQIAAVTDQLDAANSAVQDLRSQLGQVNERLLQRTTQVDHDQTRLADLRAQLESAKRESGGQSVARIEQLQQQLAVTEKTLAEKQASIGTLSADLVVQQTQMSEQLAKSQAENSHLNDLLASGRSETESLRARLAQSEQRLNQTQQELSAVRTDYLRQTSALAARSEELQKLRAHGGDAVQALLETKQRELDGQQLQIKSLEAQVAAAHQQASATGSSASDATARNQGLERSLQALRTQYAQQQQELQEQRSQFAHLQSQSKTDRDALSAQMAAGMSARAGQLEEQQKRIAALQAEASQLREAYNRDRQAHEHDATTASAETQREQDELRAAQEKIAKQQDTLEHLEMELAARQLELVRARQSAAQQPSSEAQANQKRIASLETDVRDRDKQIADLRFELAKAGTPANPPSVAGNVSYRMAQTAGPGGANPDALMRMVRGLGPANYHALIIGNSNYLYMEKLKTPVGDAREIATVLQKRYGFDVKLLTDATRDQIMAAMNEYARTLTDSDRLLIYYAGHGGTRIDPPERAFWLGVDANPELRGSWLSAQMVADAVGEIHARHILLVADSCFSSVITHPTSTTVARSDDEHSTAIRWSKGARMVLTSGENEPVVDTSAADPSHSLFASQFITVLRQNDILMSGEMLAHELSSRMAVFAARMGLKQTPTYSNLQDPAHKFGDFFFLPVDRSTQVAALTR
jgi:hypothetical protein